jgi:OOP family OmpA-OmpF porin
MEESEKQADEGALLDQLRRELMGSEQRRIQDMEEVLRDPERLAERVSRVLPAAVKSSSAQGTQLAWALRPALESSIRETVRTRREEFAEAIAPIIGPSIARAMKTAIAEMLERITQALAVRFSVQSVRWRVEALRTGRSFAEIVFLRTLVFQVEQVLLVDRESGLLLCHVTGPGVAPQQPARVSALLTAINAFSREALDVQHGLDRIEVGELSVWIESGPRMMLAAVVRGPPPSSSANCSSSRWRRSTSSWRERWRPSRARWMCSSRPARSWRSA